MDFIFKKKKISYNSNKSIVYLDIVTNILIKILLDNYNYYGQEIELVNIKVFCDNYHDLLDAYPYRKSDFKLNELLEDKNNYITNTLYESFLIDNIIIKSKENYYISILLELYKDTNQFIKNIIKYQNNHKNLIEIFNYIYHYNNYNNELVIDYLYKYQNKKKIYWYNKIMRFIN